MRWRSQLAVLGINNGSYKDVKMPLFSDLDEENAARVIAAGIALHGLLGRRPINTSLDQNIVIDAFKIADLFIDEAKKRLPG